MAGKVRSKIRKGHTYERKLPPITGIIKVGEEEVPLGKEKGIKKKKRIGKHKKREKNQ